MLRIIKLAGQKGD